MRILNRTITVVIALLLTLGVFAPQTAHAAPNPASLTIAPTTTDGTPITGGTWTITQTATINPATGASTPVAGTPVTVDAGATTPLAQYAVYTVTQATRAPGYYLDTETYTVEFPLLTGGQWATDQSLTIAPKLTPVTGDASLVKQANGTTTPIEGATFELYRTVDASGATLPTPELVTTVTTGADGTVSATALTEGSYYWIETSVPAPYAVDTTTTYPFQVTVDAAGTATAPIEQAVAQNYTAPAASEVIKAVNGGPTTSASVGETVTFTITATLPGDIDQFDAYTLTDTFDARFSSVTVADPVPAGFAADVTGNTVTLTGTPASLTPGEVTFTITAVVNNTTASGDSIPNTATVTWDNGRGDAGTFVTNAATVTLVEGSITVIKTDGDTGALLPGATFTLTDADGTPLTDIDGNPYAATTDVAGQLVFERLPFGTYYLQETAAPDGYRLSEQLTEVTVNATTTNPTVTVTNYSTSSVLPDTGTWGAWPFYALGAALIGLFLVLQRRQRDAAI